MKKKEKAAEIFSGGYNCAQAELGAFCENYGLDTDTALADLAAPFETRKYAERCLGRFW